MADTNHALIRPRRFADAFGTPHDTEIPSEYSPAEHVTEDAATEAFEDFAEVFGV